MVCPVSVMRLSTPQFVCVWFLGRSRDDIEKSHCRPECHSILFAFGAGVSLCCVVAQFFLNIDEFMVVGCYQSAANVAIHEHSKCNWLILTRIMVCDIPFKNSLQNWQFFRHFVRRSGFQLIFFSPHNRTRYNRVPGQR